MPFATFTRIREVSSEDNVHLAENLIKNQPGKKWKTKNSGEKSAYVVLEMSENQQITGIDIGNEHSAFVEVLVGKSACAPKDFTEILITCSFMTPIESKSSNNTNRVRCFNREALVPTAANNKWSFVKILCTQPFNKHVPYGLSFIKIHVSDNEKKASVITPKNLVPEQLLNKTKQIVGKFKFREDSPDSECENSSSLFNRWKKSKDNDCEQTTAASIRMASKSPITLVSRQTLDIQKLQTSQVVKSDDRSIPDRNRENLLFGDDDKDHTDNEKLDRLSAKINADKERRRIKIEKEMNSTKCKSHANTIQTETPKIVNDNSTEPSSSKKATTSSKVNVSIERVNKRKSSPPENSIKKVKPVKVYRPFNQLLNGVILVISGIQNPDRGDLRNKAIALGAKYKADWDSTCTHLICAFKNTPKYNQVKGKGKIVTRSWIEKCYSLKKYLPWRRYALNSIELSKPESDDEIFDDTQKIQTEETNSFRSMKKSRNESEDSNGTLALYDIDDKPKTNNITDRIYHSSSDSDTDDEINRINQSNNSSKPNLKSKILDIYEASTDEEDYTKQKLLQIK